MKIVIQYFILFIMLLVINAEAQTQSIKEFYIECDLEEFDYMYENYNEEIFIPILFMHNGNSWSDVRLRIRGDSSKEYPKKSLKVVFDSTPFVTGEDALNINAEYQDKSYMNSVLSSRLFNDVGIDCAKMEHIRLYLNGSFYGLYVLTENVDENFLESRNYDTSGNLYKATKDGACLSVFDNIFYHWEKKLDNIPGRNDLADLIFSLNHVNAIEYSDYLQSNFVYSQFTSFIALNMLLANGSTYYHNYYLYNDANNTGKWFILPWDMDRTFASYSKWYRYHRSSGYWSADNPILERSIIQSEVFSEIRNKLAELDNTLFNSNYLFPIIDSLYSVIETSVLEDTTDNIQDIEAWNVRITDNKNFILDRYNQLVYQIANVPLNFRVNRFSDYFLPNEIIPISWSASSDPNGDEIFYKLYYGQDRLFEDPSTTVISGITENTYLINGLSNEGKYYYKVEASDDSNVIPGFDTYNSFFVSASIQDVVINEVNYNSSNEFDSEDWVEFYNPNEIEVDLSGWFFMDANNEHKFFFPEGTIINPNEYLVLCKDTSLFFNVFPDTIPVIGNMNFGLSSSGEWLRLYHKTGYLVDSLVYDNDFPWPSEPNGEGPTLELINPGVDNAIGYNWRASYENGTPGVLNSTYSPDSYAENSKGSNIYIKHYPNPFIDYINIEFDLCKSSDIELLIYDVYGSVKLDKQYENQNIGKHLLSFPTNHFKTGIYIYQFLIDGVPIKSEKITKTNK